MLSEFPQIKPWIDSLQTVGALRDTFIIQRKRGRVVGLPGDAVTTAHVGDAVGVDRVMEFGGRLRVHSPASRYGERGIVPSGGLLPKRGVRGHQRRLVEKRAGHQNLV